MKDIRTYPIHEIPQIIANLGEPKFRAKQLTKWLYQAGAESYDEMTNLPAKLRASLTENYPLARTNVVDKQVSKDGTRKYVLELSDGVRVETVGIPVFGSNPGETKHLTVCFSTQAGCAMECAFCATGHEGLTRNLSAGEMVLQVLTVQKDFDARVTNVVSMGQGEPFQNYDATLEAIRFMNAKEGLGIGARHITLSTCGVLQGIQRLSNEPEQFTLAVSLHSARQNVRNDLMPRCKNLPLDALKADLLQYVEKTGRRVSLEYLLIKDVNDTQEDLDALIEFTQGLLCHVNIIPMNAVSNSPFQPSTAANQKYWAEQLNAAHKETTIRNSRGSDIDGACGQLKNKLKNQ